MWTPLWGVYNFQWGVFHLGSAHSPVGGVFTGIVHSPVGTLHWEVHTSQWRLPPGQCTPTSGESSLGSVHSPARSDHRALYAPQREVPTQFREYMLSSGVCPQDPHADLRRLAAGASALPPLETLGGGMSPDPSSSDKSAVRFLLALLPGTPAARLRRMVAYKQKGRLNKLNAFANELERYIFSDTCMHVSLQKMTRAGSHIEQSHEQCKLGVKMNNKQTETSPND